MFYREIGKKLSNKFWDQIMATYDVAWRKLSVFPFVLFENYRNVTLAHILKPVYTLLDI